MRPLNSSIIVPLPCYCRFLVFMSLGQKFDCNMYYLICYYGIYMFPSCNICCSRCMVERKRFDRQWMELQSVYALENVLVCWAWMELAKPPHSKWSLVMKMWLLEMPSWRNTGQWNVSPDICEFHMPAVSCPLVWGKIQMNSEIHKSLVWYCRWKYQLSWGDFVSLLID